MTTTTTGDPTLTSTRSILPRTLCSVLELASDCPMWRAGWCFQRSVTCSLYLRIQLRFEWCSGWRTVLKDADCSDFRFGSWHLWNHCRYHREQHGRFPQVRSPVSFACFFKHLTSLHTHDVRLLLLLLLHVDRPNLIIDQLVIGSFLLGSSSTLTNQLSIDIVLRLHDNG